MTTPSTRRHITSQRPSQLQVYSLPLSLLPLSPSFHHCPSSITLPPLPPSAPQDYYDPETENTLEQSFTCAATTAATAATKRCLLEEGSAKVGTKVDLYCTKNKVYYEAAIKQVRRPRRAGDATRLLFHFLGWSSCFDEWVPIDR